jgi:hypothetical protein
MESRLSKYKLIYLIIHVLVYIFEALLHFGLEFSQEILYFISYYVKDRRKGSFVDEAVLIERRVQDLDKIPQHIAVILHINNETDVDLSKLSDLVSWSLNSGVNFISFYDFKGLCQKVYLSNIAPLMTFQYIALMTSQTKSHDVIDNC